LLLEANEMNSPKRDHLSQDLIFRTLDDELTAAEHIECESHLAVCEMCRQKLSSLRDFSAHIEAAVLFTPIPAVADGRRNLQKAIEEQRLTAPVVLQHPARVMRRFGWGMAIAATLAFGVLLAPKHEAVVPSLTVEPANQTAAAAQTGTIDVDGETFLPVPYSNADLQAAAPHIVEMQVPIAALVDVGIVLEPVSNRMGSGQDGEGSVLADVLVGADGQPRGVHVLAAD
jgi:anti-sigma factor RsiW